MALLQDKTSSGKGRKNVKINVTVRETQITEYTYEITGVNSIEAAKRVALQAANHKYQSNAWVLRKVPYPPTLSTHGCEVVEV